MDFIRLLGFVFILNSCAANLQKPTIDLSSSQDAEFKLVKPDAEVSGVAKYKIEGKGDQQVEWFSCSAQKKGDVVVLINPDFKPFDNKVCRGAVAQAFLNHNISVFAINRPGYGGSTPKGKDFSGPVTSEAIDAAIATGITSINWFKKPKGVWGTGSGVIAAGLLSKRMKDIEWLILGNGVYDVEEFYSKVGDSPYKKMIDEARSEDKADTFFEYRSLAWDTSGLAKSVTLYHGKADAMVSFLQSESMKDTLAAEEYKVNLELIEELPHNISASQHRVILESILTKWAKTN